MLNKRFALAAAFCLCLAQTLMLPFPALSATTSAGNSTLLMTTVTTYPTTAVTSVSNKVVTITVTPLALNGSQWTYQISWSRARNAQGSLFVTMRADKSQEILTADPADRTGSATFTVTAGTSYRVEFYSAPNQGGVLLVRRFFVARTVASAKNSTAKQTLAPVTLNSTGNNSGANSQSALTNPNSVTQPYSTSINQLGIVQNAYVSDPTAIDYLGQLTGPGTVANLPANCNQDLLTTGYGFVYNGGGQSANPPLDVACRTIAQNWVAAIDYKGSDGSCYHADWTGTYKLDCNVIQKITGTTPQTLPGGQIPTNTYDPSVNWAGFNTKCFYTVGDTQGVPYGTPTPTICGASHGTNSLLPSQSQILNSTSNQSNPFSTALNPFSLVQNAYLSDPTALDYLGTLTGGGTVANLPAGCDQSKLSQGYGFVYGDGNQSANPPLDVACRTVGKGWVAAIDYKGSDGNCYHADWTGTYKLDCNVIQKITGITPQTLPGGQIPTSTFDPAFNWAAYNTKCYYTTGDNPAAGGPYGVPSQAICGALHGTNSLLPNQNQILSSTGNSVNPFSTALNPLSLVQNAYMSDPTAVDYLGSLVGGGTVSNFSASCDQSKLSQGYGFVYGDGNQSANPPLDVACRTIGKGWIGSIDYKDTAGQCYHADWTGKYAIDCNILQKVTGSIPPVLPGGKIPTNTFDSSINWSAYNTKCYYTTGDNPSAGGPYGVPSQAICGAFHGTNSLLPSQDQILNSAPPTANPYSTALNPLTLLAGTYSYNPTGANYLGTLVGPGTVGNFPPICDQNLISSANGYGGLFASSGLNPSDPTIDAACRTINKGWVGSIDYKGSDGKCYHADWTGTYQQDCAVLQKVTGTTPQTLPGGQIPTNIYDSSINWNAYHTKCYYTTGDRTGPYGFPHEAVCGAFHSISMGGQ